MVPRHRQAPESSRRLVKLNQATGPHPGVPNSVGLGWGRGIFVSNRFPGDTATGSVENPALKKSCFRTQRGAEAPAYLLEQTVMYVVLGICHIDHFSQLTDDEALR